MNNIFSLTTADRMWYNERQPLITGALHHYTTLSAPCQDRKSIENFERKAMKNKLLYILASLLIWGGLCTSLPACAPPPDTPSEDSARSEESVISYTDALGRELRLDKKPARVAALLGSFADVWVLAGGELCAAAEDAREDFGLDLGEAVNLGGAHSPNGELLLAADPDLVLASASTASHVELLETLEALGIQVVYFNVDNFEDYLSMLDLCTDLTGRKDLYEQNGLRVRDQINTVKAAYAQADLPAEDRTVLLLRASSGFVKAKGSRGTILGEMLADMGCINIADSDQTLLDTLSVEAVIRSEPRHIFVVTMGNSTEAALESLARMMEENPAWGSLEAVRADRLHVMDKTLFNLKPNDRWGEAYETLFETLTKE